MTQDVWGDFFDNAGLTRVLADEIFDGDGSEAMFFGEGDVGEGAFFPATVTEKYRLEVICSLVQV